MARWEHDAELQCSLFKFQEHLRVQTLGTVSEGTQIKSLIVCLVMRVAKLKNVMKMVTKGSDEQATIQAACTAAANAAWRSKISKLGQRLHIREVFASFFGHPLRHSRV